ncbi:transcription termination/antitermination protein NusG [Candidatus Gottesmanbacteria bacterium RBG_16_37_8]|uniref:Transcription termination/antitermination protein NusG n=1 Tax=Candidatus Gottesmanbacteria bacterium RBG_16_37_8 TaxID=1798371 RepID=A0A1F5YT19_9BACT|nr:MAG: transcription termination/antitermination protein NusG [Candidatus Gottesmanbacteria bacterium RBG_16_37_8]
MVKSEKNPLLAPEEKSASSDQTEPSAEPSAEPAAEATTAETTPPGATDADKSKGNWYVVHTYSGHENKAAAALQQRVAAMNLTAKIFDIIVPTRNIVVVRHGKKEETKEKIFPGYILVRMNLDDESWLAVRTTQGVTAFVGMGNKPTPISDKEVTAIMKFMELEAPKFKTKFSKGEAVKIVDGPFADFLGSIDQIDEEKGKVKVLVSIFGRETPVELDFLQIRKL